MQLTMKIFPVTWLSNTSYLRVGMSMYLLPNTYPTYELKLFFNMYDARRHRNSKLLVKLEFLVTLWHGTRVRELQMLSQCALLQLHTAANNGCK